MSSVSYNMRNRFTTLYARELLPDRFESVNDYRQLLLQENKESEDKRAQDANHTRPNQHADL